MSNLRQYHDSSLEHTLDVMSERLDRLSNFVAQIRNRLAADYEERNQDCNGNPLHPEHEIQEG